MQIICILGFWKKTFQGSQVRFWGWAITATLLILCAIVMISFVLSYWCWRIDTLARRDGRANRARDLSDVVMRVADVGALVSQADSIAAYLIHDQKRKNPSPVVGPFSLPDQLSFTDKASVLHYADGLMTRATVLYQLLANIRRVMANQHATAWLMPSLQPVQHAYLSSGFGPRINPFNGKVEFHRGCDFAAPIGTPIHAAATGVVSHAGPSSGYGNMVALDHSHGYTTVYAHCSKILVHVGELVRQGAVLALVGSTGRSTGPHVHFEVRHYGVAQDPLVFLQRLPRTS